MDALDTYESPDEVAENVYVALGMIRDKGLALSPNNIALCYAYASGKYPDVTRAIDTLVESGAALTEKIMTEFHERYLTSRRESQAVADVSGRLRKGMQDVQAVVGQASQGAAQYVDRLKDAATRLNGDVGGAGVRQIVDELIFETRSIEATASELKEKLATTVADIDSIRQEFDSIRQEALTDQLTGLPNRRAFDLAVRSAMDHAAKNGTPLSVVLLDVNGFHRFNTMHGMAIGDNALRLVARTMIDAVRGQDIVARFADDEFAILLPSTSIQGGLAVAENIQRILGSRSIVHRQTGKDYGNLSVALGVAEQRSDDTAAELIRRATDAVRQAKNAQSLQAKKRSVEA